MAIAGKEPSSWDPPTLVSKGPFPVLCLLFPSALGGHLLALVTLAKLPGQPVCLPKPPCSCSPAPPLHRGKKAPFWLHLYRSSQSSGAHLKGQCQNNVTGILVASLGNMARIFDRTYSVVCSYAQAEPQQRWQRRRRREIIIH